MRNPNTGPSQRNSSWKRCIECRRAGNHRRKLRVIWGLLIAPCTIGAKNLPKPVKRLSQAGGILQLKRKNGVVSSENWKSYDRSVTS
jgi:hypothetical protein